MKISRQQIRAYVSVQFSGGTSEFDVAVAWTKAELKYLPAAPLTIPAGRLSLREALVLIKATLLIGWQATYFVSHVIPYKGNRQYAHGVSI